jgi:adenosylcobinamide-phosphate synthase
MTLLTYCPVMENLVLPSSLIVVAAVLVDQCAGELRRFHPLVGFGNIATKIDSWLFKKNFLKRSYVFQRSIGIVALMTVVVPFVLLARLAEMQLGALIDVAALYFAIGAKSLGEHGQKVHAALVDDDIVLARQRVAMIVSRNTDALDATAIARATIESILENGSDAIFCAIFWFMVLGPAGAVLFRLSNTLDAMWGYKTEKYLHFGWAAARLDDVLCWLPSRLTALSYAIVGDTILALKCWWYQARLWYSPNAGPVMSSGAGALRLQLGGAATYNKVLKERPILGKGDAPNAADIPRALALVRNALILWVTFIVIGDVVLHAQTWWTAASRGH